MRDKWLRIASFSGFRGTGGAGIGADVVGIATSKGEESRSIGRDFAWTCDFMFEGLYGCGEL